MVGGIRLSLTLGDGGSLSLSVGVGGLIYKALALGLPTIDATPVLTSIHQAHGYGHVKEDKVLKAMEGGIRRDSHGRRLQAELRAGRLCHILLRGRL